MTKLSKVLSLALALAMVFTCTAFAEGTQLAADAQTEIDIEAYGEQSTEIYNAILGDFYGLYMQAKEEAGSIAERYALMALAEGKLLGSAVMIPLQSRGGNYAITRTAPRTVPSVLWGNDEDRIHQMLIVSDEKPLLSSEVEELRELWNETRGTGTWEASAKAYLTEKGHTLTDVYTLGNSTDPQTWDVLATSLEADSEKIVLTYDGLYEYDNENVQQPALAESYTVSEDGTVYTFTLKSGVKWVDSQGREVADVKADDFVAGMQHMLDAAGGLEYLVGADGCNIKNASAYTSGEISDFAEVGVKAIDDVTLEYTLEAECPFFTTMLGYGVFAPMSRDYYTSQGGAFGADYAPDAETYTYGKDPDHIAYCGPYLVTNYTAQNVIVFQANPAYYNADKINIHTVNWNFNDGTDALKSYNDFKAGILSGCGLNSSSVEQAKADGLFDDYHYVSATNATSFMGFFNVNRIAFANFNDATHAVSPKTVEDAERTKAAMSNIHFRRALLMSLDRGAYNAQSVGEELKYNNLINSYTPGNFVYLPEDATVSVNGVETTFPAGTFFGEIVQAQLDADGVTAKVWDAELNGGVSYGFDGWYNPENAKAEMALAVAELAEQGVEITTEKPITIDLPTFTGSESYANRAEALKQSVEAATDKMIQVNKVDCPTSDDWYYAGYYYNTGNEANFDLCDLSGWGPDYGDPQSYLDTMLPDYSGYMVKALGIF